MGVSYIKEVSQYIERHAREGQVFVVSHRWEGVASGSSVDFIFQNPTGSGKELNLVILEIFGTDQAWIDMFADSTIDTAGTSLTPVNKYLGHSGTSVAHVEIDGSYTTGTQIHATVLSGGSGWFASGGGSELGVGGIIGEGHLLHVRLTNKSSNANDLSIRVVWWE